MCLVNRSEWRRESITRNVMIILITIKWFYSPGVSYFSPRLHVPLNPHALCEFIS